MPKPEQIYDISVRVELRADSEEEARSSLAAWIAVKGDRGTNVQGVSGCNGIVDIEVRDAKA